MATSAQTARAKNRTASPGIQNRYAPASITQRTVETNVSR